MAPPGDQPTQGKTNDAIIDPLNFALKLEYLEAGFYAQAVANASAIGLSGQALADITTIRDPENAYVKFLQDAITAAKGAYLPKPNINLSGGGSADRNGPFKAAVTSDYALVLAVAQTFEDTGVRACKGVAPSLTSNNGYLTAALNIHSVAARHAAARCAATTGSRPR